VPREGDNGDLDEQEIEKLKTFLRYFFDHHMAASNLSAELHPVTVFERLFVRAPKQARSGLRMAINDCMEITTSWPAQRIAAVDTELRAQGLPTLSQLRLRYSTQLNSIVKRGHIRSEVEYYLVRGALEDPNLAPGEAGSLRKLIEMFEASAVSKRRR
jgi:hypothetical protein